MRCDKVDFARPRIGWGRLTWPTLTHPYLIVQLSLVPHLTLRVGLADEIQPHSHSRRRGGQFDNRSKCYFVETMRVEDTVPSPLAQNRDRFRLSFTICRRQGATIITSVYGQVHGGISCLDCGFETSGVIAQSIYRSHSGYTLVYIYRPTGLLLSRGFPGERCGRAMSKVACVKKSRLLPDPEGSRRAKGTVESYLCLMSEDDAPRHSHTWLFFTMRRTREIRRKMCRDR